MSENRPEPNESINLNKQIEAIDNVMEILKRQEETYARNTYRTNPYKTEREKEAELVRSSLVHDKFMQVVEHFNETGELEGEQLLELVRIIRA